jgi:hypothetical protein
MESTKKIKQLKKAKQIIFDSIDILISQEEEAKYFEIISTINKTIKHLEK